MPVGCGMRRSTPSASTRLGPAAARPPDAAPGQRIGLLGGSFDPPHAAHVLVSETALRRLGLDRMWWLVTPGNPLKSHEGLPPIEARIALCRRLVRDPRIVATGLEAGLGSPYTAATLSYLRGRLPGVHLVWVMGADCLAELHRWKRWREIFGLLPVAVVDRPGWHLPALASPAARAFAGARIPEAAARALPTSPPPAWTMLTGPLSPLSSSAIRAGLPPRPPLIPFPGAGA